MPCSLALGALERFESLDPKYVDQAIDFYERGRLDDYQPNSLPNVAHFVEQLKIFSEASLHDSSAVITLLCSQLKDAFQETAPPRSSHRQLMLLRGLEVALIQLLTSAGTSFPKDFYWENSNYGMMGAARFFTRNTASFIRYIVPKHLRADSMSSAESSSPEMSRSTANLARQTRVSLSGGQSIPQVSLPIVPEIISDNSFDNQVFRKPVYRGNIEVLLEEILDAVHPVISRFSMATSLGISVLRVASRIVYIVSTYSFEPIQRRVAGTLNASSKILEEGNLENIIFLQHAKPSIQDVVDVLKGCLSVLSEAKRSTAIILIQNVQQFLWNWIESSDMEFSSLTESLNEEVNHTAGVLAGLALELFDTMDALLSEKKGSVSAERRRHAIWPVMTMMLVLSNLASDAVLGGGVATTVSSSSQTDAAAWSAAAPLRRSQRFWARTVASLRAGHRQQRDAAALCCVTMCRMAGFAASGNPLRAAVRDVLESTVGILLCPKSPWSYTADRLHIFSPIPSSAFDLQVVTQLAQFSLSEESVDLFVECMETEHPTACLVSVCALRFLIQTQGLLGLEDYCEDLGWRLRKLFMDSGEQLQKAFDKTKEKVAPSQSVFQAITNKVFGTKSRSLDDIVPEITHRRRKDSADPISESDCRDPKKNGWFSLPSTPHSTSPALLHYQELLETIHQLLDLFTLAPSLAMVVCLKKSRSSSGMQEFNVHSCCRYLISSMRTILDCSIEVVPHFIVSLTELMAVFHGPRYVNLWDPFSAKLWVGVYMVLETTSEFLLYLSQAALRTIDEVCTESLLKALYKLLIERNVFIRQNFNEVVTTVDVEFFSSSLDMLEALLLVGVTHSEHQTIHWSVLCLNTLVTLIDSLSPFDSWITGPETMSKNFKENLNHYRTITALHEKSTTVPSRKAILDTVRRLDKHTEGSLFAWQSMAKRWRELTTQLMEDLMEGAVDQREVMDSVAAKKWSALTQSVSALSGALPVTSENKELLETAFLTEAVSLLSCSIKGYAGTTIQTTVRQALENISPSAIPKCLNMVEQKLTSILEQGASGAAKENTMFVEQVTSLLNPMFEVVALGTNKYMSFVNVEAIVLQLSTYIKEFSETNITLQIHFCRIVQTMMNCRTELFFRREHYFCNCLSKCLVDWLQRYRDVVADTSRLDRDFLLVCVAALGQLFTDLIVDDAVVTESPQRVYNEYWDAIDKVIEQCTCWACGMSGCEENYYAKNTTVLIHPRSSIASCTDVSSVHQQRGKSYHGFFSVSLAGPQYASDLLELAQVAMSNLLCADTNYNGRNASDAFSRVIKYCDHCHVKCRAYFIENMTAILRQGVYCQQRENLSIIHLNNLCNIIVTKNKSGRYPIADVLMKVTSNLDQDELCTGIAKLFYSRGLLYDLVETFFMKELQKVVTPSALFRSATHATRMVSSAMKHFGLAYAKGILKPILEKELEKFAAEKFSYEIDPNKLRNDEDNIILEKNRRNVLSLTKRIFEAVTTSLPSLEFPPQLITICHCLLVCTFSRFPTHCESVVGNAFFLRFLNPMLTQPQTSGLIASGVVVPSSFHRGLVLVAKTLQNIGNQLLFRKEKHMLCFNDYLQSVFPIGKEFLIDVSRPTVWKSEHSGYDMFELEEHDQRYMQRVLWNTQEKIGYKIYTSRKVPDGHNLFQDLILCLGNLGVPPGLNTMPSSSMKRPSQDQSLVLTKPSKSTDLRISGRMDSGPARTSIQKCFSRCTIGQSQQGIVVSLAMHNMTSANAKLRMSAYNLLFAALKSFNMGATSLIHDTADTPVLLYGFSVDTLCSISAQLASCAPHLTLDIWQETLHHCLNSSAQMVTWSMKSLTPWLAKFIQCCTGGLGDSDTDKGKATRILDNLVTISVSEHKALFSSVLDSVWTPMAQYPSVFPMVLRILVKNKLCHALGSMAVEKASGIVIALSHCPANSPGNNTSSSSSSSMVSAMLNEIFAILQADTGDRRKFQELERWSDLSLLVYFVCSSVLDKSFDVVPMLPRLFHIIICLNECDCTILQEALHGLAVNILHALCSWSKRQGADQSVRSELHVRLDNLIQQHYYNAFGIGEPVSSDSWDVVTNLQMVIGLFLDVLKIVCNLSQCNELLLQWERYAETAVLSKVKTLFLPPCVTILAMISSYPEQYYRVLLVLLSEACEDFVLNERLVCGILGTLANILHRIDLDVSSHASLFWLSVGILQLNYLPVYCFGLDLMQASLHAMDAGNIVQKTRIVNVLCEERLQYRESLDLLDASLSLWQPHTHFTLLLALVLVKAFQDPSARLVAERVIYIFLFLNKDPAWEADSTTNPAALSIFSSSIWPFVALLLPFNEEARSMVQLMSRQGRPAQQQCSLSMTSQRCADAVQPARHIVHRSISNTLLDLNDNEQLKGQLSALDVCTAAESLNRAVSTMTAQSVLAQVPSQAHYLDMPLNEGGSVSPATEGEMMVRDDMLYKMLSAAVAPSNLAMPPVAALANCKIFENDDMQMLVTYLIASTLVTCREQEQVPHICDFIVAFSTHFQSTFSSICDVVRNLLSHTLTNFHQISCNNQVLALVNLTAATPCDHNSTDFSNPIVASLGFKGAPDFLRRWQTAEECSEAAQILGSFVRELLATGSF